jgi:hypothetical protein
MARGKRFIAAFAILGVLCINAPGAEERYGAATSSLKEDLDRLVAAYPDTVTGHDNMFLTLKNGTRFLISDGRTDKTFQELLESPDIDDMFYARYPAGAEPKQPDVNSDPGRVRFAPLFAAMYGDCTKNEVAQNLRTVKWLPKHGGGSVKVTTVNGVADAISRRIWCPRPARTIAAKWPGRARRQCMPMELRSTSTRGMRTIGAGRPASSRAGATGFPLRSCGSSRSTASSGAAPGITTIPCTSNIARSCCRVNFARQVLPRAA